MPKRAKHYKKKGTKTKIIITVLFRGEFKSGRMIAARRCEVISSKVKKRLFSRNTGE